VDGFVPGAYWTPELAEGAIRRMINTFASPEFQAMVQQMGDDFQATHEPGVMQTPSVPTGKYTHERIRYRRGTADDIPQLSALILSANLPPLFMEEFIEGFAVAEQDGKIIACGALEVYDRCGVIRSIAVDKDARGLGLGRTITDLLVEEARRFPCDEVYLMTVDAWEFWKHVGFVDVAPGEWAPPAQKFWQYQFVTAEPERAATMGVHFMRLPK
jgi:amino-acid N-acetyltransferase